MPKIVETTVYLFEELDDAGKEKARAWYRETMPDDNWHECVYDDFEAICAILGVRLKIRPVRLMGGGIREKPCIFFAGFWSQGDGACFEASYAYTKEATRKIRAYAPKDTKLHAIADTLRDAQRRNFYQLNATVIHRGHYSHEYCMVISVERDSSSFQAVTADAEEQVTEALRDLARWLYRQLEREYVHITSDEVVDETIIANGYTFTRDGRRFG